MNGISCFPIFFYMCIVIKPMHSLDNQRSEIAFLYMFKVNLMDKLGTIIY